VTPSADVEIRRLTPNDRQALAIFSCRGGGAWTVAIEEMIRDRLADELELTDDLEAYGLWVGDQLAGVVAWRFKPEGQLCHSLVLAVDHRHQRRGYGRRLKEMEIAQARQAGARAVVSLVHWNNDPIINLNWGLGGTFSHPPGDPMHLHCVIPLSLDQGG
jgi:ribosomal protein S18 acetylase RimI-like enzyme